MSFFCVSFFECIWKKFRCMHAFCVQRGPKTAVLYCNYAPFGGFETVTLKGTGNYCSDKPVGSGAVPHGLLWVVLALNPKKYKWN